MFDERNASLALNTLKLVAGTLALSLPVGSALGLLIARTDLPLRRMVAALLGWLLIVPLYLQAAAWQSGFGLYGWHTLAFGGEFEAPWLIGWRGAIWVHAIAALPWVALIVGLTSRQVEPQLEEAALLDTSPLGVFWRITLRRIAPAIGLAALWVALQTATDMTVTDLYQVRTFAEEVYIDFAAPADLSSEPIGPWISVAMLSNLLIGALALLAAGAQQSAKLLPRLSYQFELGTWRWPLAGAVIACVAIAVGTPLVNLVVKCGVVVQASGEQIERSWSAAKCLRIVAAAPAEFYAEIGRSLVAAALAATVAVVVALPLAWLARRGGAKAVPAIAIAAILLATPGPLLGIGLIHLLNQPDRWMQAIYNSLAAPILAQAIRGLPIATFIVWVAFRSIPSEQFEAAALDGAGVWKQFYRLALPQRWPAVLGAWVAAGIIAMNELPATVLLEVPGRATLPIAVFQLLHGSGEDRLAGIVLFMVLLFAVAVVLGLLIWRLSRGAQLSEYRGNGQ